jgi:hypothetical protein
MAQSAIRRLCAAFEQDPERVNRLLRIVVEGNLNERVKELGQADREVISDIIQVHAERFAARAVLAGRKDGE